MRIEHVEPSVQDGLFIKLFGVEDVGVRAKWNSGARNVYILHYVLSGKGYFDGAPVGKGQGFLIRPGRVAEYHYDEKEPWNYFWVMFDGVHAEDICRKYIPSNEKGIFDYAFSEHMPQIIASMFSLTRSLSYTEGLTAFFYILSLHERKATRLTNQHVENAKSYMYLHIDQPFSVSDVAAAVGVSDRYLYNLFVKYEGIAPKSYMNELRLKNAKALLKNSRYTITEIAEAVGFSDVFAFSRFFTKFTGRAPSAYRKEGVF